MGKIALAALPASRLLAKPDSKISGVQIGLQTYSFRAVTADVDEIIKDMVKIGLSAAELMSNSVELAAGAPAMPRMGPPPGVTPGTPPTPEQMAAMRARNNGPEMQKAREELANWRKSAPVDKFKMVRQKFDTAGIDLRLLCYNMNERTTDDEIDYAFQMAKALGVKAMTTSTQVTVSKRIAPFSDKYKMMVGYHGHDNVNNPNEFATLESFATAMTYSKYAAINLDIGHFTASNFDPIPYIKEHQDRITNLHLKDRKKDHGPNTPWGQGDTPIKAVLQLMKKEKYPFPANIEYEYKGESDPVTEVAKCYEYCKENLA